MAQENRTEQPTPKRIREARQRGDVPQSAALSSAILFLGLLLVFFFEAGTLARQLTAAAVRWWSALPTVDDAEQFTAIWSETTFSYLGLFVRFALCAAILPALVAVVQRGWLFLPEKAVPDFSRIGFSGAFGRLCGVETLWRFCDAALKALFCVAACWLGLRGWGGTIPDSAQSSGALLFDRCSAFALRLGLALLILSAGDWVYRRWKWNRDLRMTPDEIRREREESEGKPEIKAIRNDLIRSFRRRMK